MAECKHAATPLSSCSINTTHQGFQKRYITKVQRAKVQIKSPIYTILLSKSDFSFALLLVTFELLEVEQSYIPLMKALMCGINAVEAQGCGCMFTFCHAYLKMGVLLHKMAIVCNQKFMAVHETFNLVWH